MKKVNRLLKENVLRKIFVTGNPIVDAAYQNKELLKKLKHFETMELKRKKLLYFNYS